MNHKSKLVFGGVLAALLTFTAAAPAMAASASGTYNCGSGTRVAQLTSETNGATSHRWTNASTGATKVSNFSGGLNRSTGYQNSQWVLTATQIISRSLTCAG